MGELGPGLRYGALAFLAGGVLGPLRELVLAPRIGGLPAALAEAAAMAGWLWLLARWGLPPGATQRERRLMTALGLGIVLLGEAALFLAFTATGLAAQRMPRSAAEQAVGLAPLAWMAALPFLVRRR